VAQISKKRARELKKEDKFQQATHRAFDRAGNLLEGKGRTILYALIALIALAALFGIYSSWRGRRSNEARAALGRAIEIAETPVSPSPVPGAATPSFPSERERAQKAVEEFQKVADKYDDPYREIARFMMASELLTVERAKGLSELEKISKSGSKEIAARAKFALAQGKEADGQFDQAVNLYNELLKQNDSTISADTLNLRLASIYEKQGKKNEAVDILFRMVEAARKAKDKDGKPVPQSSAAGEAAEKLEKLDPARYAQLPPESLRNDIPAF
jgi:tetratricopeptide (TPR) repeat protein